MKRLSMFAVFVVGLFALPALASAQQQQDREMFQFGVVGGTALTSATADADSYQDATDTEIGFTAGIQSNWQFHDVMALHPELLFASRGWEVQGDVLGQDVDNDYQFSYFELPLLLKASGYISDGVQLKVMGGPHAALFIDGSRDGSSDPVIGGDDGEFEIDGDQMNDLQFGATGAVGANFELGPIELTSDVRFQQNITNVFDTTAADEVQNEDDSVMHQSWQLTLGFLF